VVAGGVAVEFAVEHSGVDGRSESGRWVGSRDRGVVQEELGGMGSGGEEEREASGEKLLEVERGLDEAEQSVADEKHEKGQLDDNEAGRSEKRGNSENNFKFDTEDESKRQQSSHAVGNQKKTDSAEEREFKRRKR